MFHTTKNRLKSNHTALGSSKGFGHEVSRMFPVECLQRSRGCFPYNPLIIPLNSFRKCLNLGNSVGGSKHSISRTQGQQNWLKLSIKETIVNFDYSFGEISDKQNEIGVLLFSRSSQPDREYGQMAK